MVRGQTYLDILSNRFLRYFFCSINGLTRSENCSSALINSSMYPDCPLTKLSVDHVVRFISLNAGSQTASSSLVRIWIAAEMTLTICESLEEMAEGDCVVTYPTKTSLSSCNEIRSLKSGLIFSLIFCSSWFEAETAYQDRM